MPASIRHRPLGLVLAALFAACMVPGSAFAAGATQNVECMLPGQIQHMGGHTTMGPRRAVQTTPEDCSQRGGEYTAQEQPPSPPPGASLAATADDGAIVSCLLPAQTRQLGEKARYRTGRHTVHTTRTDCQKRGGEVYTPHTHHGTTKK
ncbi:MAG TPA: hypothetical protein VGH80_11095 [Xanthomonadaceae bacterium]